MILKLYQPEFTPYVLSTKKEIPYIVVAHSKHPID